MSVAALLQPPWEQAGVGTGEQPASGRARLRAQGLGRAPRREAFQGGFSLLG